MKNQIYQEMTEVLKGRLFLTIDDVAELMGCSRKVVYNWTRRKDPLKRPPRIAVGKTIRFPKATFVEWLLKEQGMQ